MCVLLGRIGKHGGWKPMWVQELLVTHLHPLMQNFSVWPHAELLLTILLQRDNICEHRTGELLLVHQGDIGDVRDLSVSFQHSTYHWTNDIPCAYGDNLDKRGIYSVQAVGDQHVAEIMMDNDRNSLSAVSAVVHPCDISVVAQPPHGEYGVSILRLGYRIPQSYDFILMRIGYHTHANATTTSSGGVQFRVAEPQNVSRDVAAFLDSADSPVGVSERARTIANEVLNLGDWKTLIYDLGVVQAAGDETMLLQQLKARFTGRLGAFVQKSTIALEDFKLPIANPRSVFYSMQESRRTQAHGKVRPPRFVAQIPV